MKLHRCLQSVPAVIVTLLLLVSPAVAAAAVPAPTDEFLPTLQVGSVTYSNVTVMNKTPTDVFFRHSLGMGNAKTREFDRATLLKLGYQLPEEERSKASVMSQAVTNLTADPRVQAAEAVMAEHAGEMLEKVDATLAYAVVGGLIFLHLFFSLCVRLISIKTNHKPGALVWIPILNHIPLIQAAGMSGWWFLSVLLPPVSLVAYILWSFKIANARQKSWVIGLFLLLPLTNLFAFLYLAFSGSERDEPSNGGVISLGNPPPKREAA